MTKSTKDSTSPSMPDTVKADTAPSSTGKPQDAVPEQSWMDRVGQEMIEASIRMRIDPKFREEMQKKTH